MSANSCGRQMPALYPQYTALVAPGRMLAAVGLAQPRAGWIDAVLVFEHALQDQKLFAHRVFVLREIYVGSVAHDGSGARFFLTDTVQHLALDPARRRRDPLHRVGVSLDAF